MVCVNPNCSIEVYKNFKQCIFHCDKSSFDKLLLADFYKSLKEYCERQISENSNLVANKVYLNTNGFLPKNLIIFNSFQFPIIGKEILFHPTDYFKILTLFENIHFMGCTFLTNEIELPSTILYFEECIFENTFYISKYKEEENSKHYIFYSCIFNKEVRNIREENLVMDVLLFNDCLFKGNLIFKNIIFNKNFIRNSKKTEDNKENFVLQGVRIDKCTFNEKFKLNQYNIDNLSILNSYFLSELEIMSSTVQKIYFNTCNMDKIFDANMSVFNKFNFYKVKFKEFASFEQVKFGRTDKKCEIRFLNNTFEDFSNFRGAKFFSGLNFSTVNLKQDPNFLDTQFYGKDTDRETFRIIKNSFEKTSNYIEANKFFIYEMKRYRRDLEWLKNPTKKFIVSANYCISRFGQSYFQPFILLISSMFLYSYVIDKHKEIFKNKDYIISESFNSLSLCINKAAMNLPPFSIFLQKKQGIEFVSLLFYIWFAILVWQIIVAVKRNTQH